MAVESYSGSSCAIAETVVTEPASPTSVCASCSGTVCSTRSSAASMSARIAAICSAVGGSVTFPPTTRCRSVIRTQPTSTERAARTWSSPTTNSVEPPPMSTTRYGLVRSPARRPPPSNEGRSVPPWFCPVSSPVAPVNENSAS
ncbi:hypothetical protein SAURM35S_07295 [Streptomyces aurantiogriseus]